MAKNLVIVESPAKTKTLSRFLGKQYDIKATVGHLMDLPKSKLGIDVDNGFAPDYDVIEGKEKVIKELKKAARGAEQIFLAPDPDREGEAIAWHVSSLLNGKGKNKPKIHRISFNEITKTAVLEAIKNPRAIDMNKVNAQQARRVLDRIVGYTVSPFLWKTIARNLSAGFVPIRKPGKLPRETLKAQYALEYGTDELQIHSDAISSADRVLIVDDLLATGGTLAACCKLVEQLGADIVGISLLIELTFLEGRKQLGQYPLHALLRYDSE